MLQYCQSVVPVLVLASRVNLLNFVAPCNGNITRIHIFNQTPNSNGTALFDVNINGTTIFPTQSNRPELAAGGVTALSGLLSVGVVTGDVISLDLDTVPAGGIGQRLYVQVTIDDSAVQVLTNADASRIQGRDITGATPADGNLLVWNLATSTWVYAAPAAGGASGGAGGDLAGTYPDPAVAKLRGRPVAVMPYPEAAGDTFTGSTIDNAKWTAVNNGSALISQNNNLLVRTGFNNGNTYGTSSLGSAVRFSYPTGSYIGVRTVDDVYTGNSGDFTYFRIELDTDNYIEVRFYDNKFTIHRREAGVTSSATDVLTSAVTGHVGGTPIWIRLARSGNNILFQTSNNGVTFATNVTTTPSFALTGTFVTRLGTKMAGGFLAQVTLDDYSSNVGAADTLLDGSTLVWNMATGQFQPAVPSSSAAYVGATDPSLVPANGVVADKLWVDTSTAAPYQLNKRNAANTAWESVGIRTSSGGGGGATGTVLLSEDFSGASLDAAKWTLQNASFPSYYSQAGGRGNLILPATAGVTQGLVSVSRYNMTGCDVQLEWVKFIAEQSGSGLSGQIYMETDENPIRYVQMLFYNNQTIQLQSGGVSATVVGYNRTTTRWVRIRLYPDGYIVFQASPDGEVWHTLGALTTTVPFTNLRLNLYVDNSTGAAFTALMDNLTVRQRV